MQGVMKDGGARVTFEGGAIREPSKGKGRYDLLSPFVERRDALWLELGSEKYLPRNWEKGMEYERVLDSAKRHINCWQLGMRDEDHLAAARCNLAFIMHYDDTGLAPKWNHYPDYPKLIAERAEPEKVTVEHVADGMVMLREERPADPYHRDYKIIAVDFDGCLCVNQWPEIGEANLGAIGPLLHRQDRGDKLILWTCREGYALQQALDWCARYGLKFDAVNANLPEMNAMYGNDSRKIGADEYWDDKAVNVKA